jgi:hypothetical protein
METTQEQIARNDFDRILFKIEKVEYVLVEVDKKLERFISESDKRSERSEKLLDKLDSRLWTAFFILVGMLVGLYGTIIFGILLRSPNG